MPTMHESLSAFSSKLLKIKDSLEVQKGISAQDEQQVFDILDKAAKGFSRQPASGDGGKSNTLQQKIQKLFDDFAEGISYWKEEMRARSEVRQKLEEMGNGLIVVVFGRTNAGKSTLGNFLRGKQLRVAAFDNAWKEDAFSLSPIRIIEKGKDSESDAGEEWFKEGATETTREAQLFQLPGLLWLDTPGFGSTNDDTLGELARKYVKRADLIIYLEHSDNPGLRDITQQLLNVLQEGRCTLIAINHSDQVELVRENGKAVFDADGEPLRKRVAKSAENRQKQENYLIGILKDKLPNQQINAVSISMLLAKEAVENDDNIQYQDSNIHALFAQILNLIEDENAFLHLKNRDALQNCITLINMVLGTLENNEERTLKRLDEKLSVWEDNIQKTDEDFDIEKETRAITERILSNLKVTGKLRDRLRTAAAENPTKQADGALGSLLWMRRSAMTDNSAGRLSIDISSITDGIAGEALREVQKRAKDQLKDFFDSASDIARSFPKIDPAILERKQEKYKYKVTETESYERSPDGIIEHILHFLGKKYYGRRLVIRDKEQIIDLGFNVEETVKNLSDQIESALTDYVRQDMESIREGLVYGLEMVRNCRKVLATAKCDLEQLRQNLEQKLAAGESRA